MNDKEIEQVLKSAGAREKPSADFEQKAHSRLRAEWLGLVADNRRRRRRGIVLALAASLVAAAIGVWIAAPRLTGPADAIATMALTAGEVRVKSGWFDGWHDIVEGQPLLTGQKLATGPSGRGALALPGGISARLDHDTRLTIGGAAELTLDRGALYVDSGSADVPSSRLDVITPSGSVRHVGTQYEVRVMGNEVRLRVREGQVEWRGGTGGIERSRTGEQLTITGDGSVKRLSMPLYGESWDWIAATAPGIEIEGLPLGRFLSWVGRELGREIMYASPQSESEVAGIEVHGSISGLTPAQALNAVLATTTVRAVIADGRIVVGSQERDFKPAD